MRNHVTCLLCTVRASLLACQGPSSCVLRMKAVNSAMIFALLSSRLRRNLAGKLLNEPGQPERQCVVIRVEREEEVGHASAVLLDTKLGCFLVLGAWILS